MSHASLWQAFLQQVRERADEVAIGDRKEWLTWRQLASHVERQVQHWNDDRSGAFDSAVVHVHHNLIADVVVSLACMASKRIEVAIDGRFSKPTIDRLIERSRRASFDGRCALVLWTSGTTGDPRGVMLSDDNLASNAAAKLAAAPQSVEDHRLTCLSIAHAYARTCDMGTWLLSGCCWTIDIGRESIDRTHQRPITLINTVPSLASHILHQRQTGGADWSSLRLVGVGGAALDKATFDAFSACGIEVIQGYGCTETSPVICSATPGHTMAGRVGGLVDGWEADVRSGRLFVRGRGRMIGYLDDIQATSERIDADGWFDTCDLVHQHDDGQWQILGRADDVIVLPNGFKIHPQSIETVVNSLAPVQRSVLMMVRGDLVLAIQSSEHEDEQILRFVEPLLPPGTRVRIGSIDPPLSEASGELTAKGTVRRHAVAKRFEFDMISSSNPPPVQ